MSEQREVVQAVCINVSADRNFLGVPQLEGLIGGLMMYGFLAAVAAIILGGIAWALGERLGFDRASMTGKGGVVAGAGVAFLIGAATAIVAFMSNIGGNVNC